MRPSTQHSQILTQGNVLCSFVRSHKQKQNPRVLSMASLHTSPWTVISWALSVPAVIMQFSSLVNTTSANCIALTVPAQPSSNLIVGYKFTLLASLQNFLILDEKWSCQITFCSLCREPPAHTYLNYCLLKLLWYSFSLGIMNHTRNSEYAHTSYPSCVLSLRDCSLAKFWNWGSYRAFFLPALSRLWAAETAQYFRQSSETTVTFIKQGVKRCFYFYFF